MKRLWVYDDTIKKGLAYAKKEGLDLGADVEDVNPRDFETYHVVPPEGLVDKIRRARDAGLEWPEDLPLPVVVCEGHRCVILDGHHRIEAAKQLRLTNIPAIVGSLEAWERLLPVIEQPDVIPYEDMIAIMAEAGSDLVRKNLAVEAALRGKRGE